MFVLTTYFLGPAYQIGPTFKCREQKFTQIRTSVGSLIMRIVIDARNGKFNRPIIYRYDSEERFRLLSPDGLESEVKNEELVCET